MIRYFTLVFFLQISFFSFAQNIWLNNETNVLNEQTVFPDSNFHFTIKPYTVKDFNNFNKVENVKVKSKVLNHLLNSNLLELKNNNFEMSVNPIIHSQYFFDNGSKDFFSNNRIGFNLFSKIKDKFFLTSDFFYSKLQLPFFQKQFVNSFSIIPHYGKLIANNKNNYSFISFSGELSFHPIKNIFFHIGRGKHFFGNGYRSLFLSDNSNSYNYVKATVDIWKIKYVWMATNLNDFEVFNFKQDYILYKKAAFIHYLSLNLTKRININFFETIITNPYDQKGNRVGYEAAYFNPVIFYRPVEFYSGTSDNSLLGIGANFRLFKSLHLYSQFILDDLLISTLKDGLGWWGNKYGIQAGLKAYDFMNVKGLFFRGEINIVRPYTYSHGINENSNNIFPEEKVLNLNYGNYHQNLAHPMGANFAEGITELSYNKGRFMTSATIILAKKGIDKDTISYGGDIYKNYLFRLNNYGISFLQGEISKFAFVDLKTSYLINPNYNLRFELGAYFRKISNVSENVNNAIFYFGLSSNIFNEKVDF